ncbi:hypothetical protein ZIOFF_064352 [Zingiber officinale]|uniref:Uncharacterized protein n=1 Tax=Zingiber officinale TaxID=94328 RepID=A0A8J5EVU8_ZINOF|nr:hypothetical protein ZIOFF_064352 [Zingiber officinale]
MANGLLDAIISLVASWSHHVSHATRKLSSRCKKRDKGKERFSNGVNVDEDDRVWQRDILMGGEVPTTGLFKHHLLRRRQKRKEEELKRDRDL